jgi:hypothetical protein
VSAKLGRKPATADFESVVRKLHPEAEEGRNLVRPVLHDDLVARHVGRTMRLARLLGPIAP